MVWSVAKIRKYLLYVLVFLLPLQTRWIAYDPPLFSGVWEYGRISLYSWDIILVFLVLVSLSLLWQEIKDVKFQISNFKSISNFQFPSAKVFFIYLLLLLFTLASIFWSSDKLLTLSWCVRLLEGGVLWSLIRALKPSWQALCWSLALAGTLQAAWGLWQFATQTTFAFKWLGVAAHPAEVAGTSVLLNEGGRWLRAYGGQVHPNVLGGLLVITMLFTVLLLSRYSYNKKILVFYLLLLCYAIQAAGLFVAFSRAAWLALAVSLLAWWIGERGLRSAVNIAIGVAAVVFMVFGTVLWQPTKARLIGASASSLEQQAVEERVTGIKESGGITRTAWWRGVGLGNYTKALAKRMPGLQSYRYQPVHNLFLLVLAELGVFGLAVFLWFLKERFLSQEPLAWLWLPAVAMTALFDHYWWTSASMVLIFWLLVSFAPQIKPSGE